MTAPLAPLRPWQLLLFAAPLAALLGLFLVLLWQKLDYVRLLWTDSLGAKMLLIVLPGLLGVGLFYVLGCRLLNRYAFRFKAGTFVAMQGALVAAWVFVCLSAGYILLAGPAAVQIQRNLIRG